MKQTSLTLAFLWLALASSATVQAETERGLSLEKDFRLGPVIHSGFTLYSPSPADRQYYLLEVRGENPEYGFSRLFLRVVSLYELLQLPELNTTSGTKRPVRMHHQFFTLGFESPILYPYTRPLALEWGWTGGFTLARVLFKNPEKPAAQQSGLGGLFADFPEIPATSLAQQKLNPAEPDTQFMGGELGTYFRYYQFYPFVPYLSGRMSFGNFFDLNGFVNGIEQKPTTPTPTPQASTSPLPKQRFFQSGFRLGYVLTGGFDVYLWTRGLLGLEYTMWTWDLGRGTDLTHSLVLKAGFLF